MTASRLQAHWPEYAIEAWALGTFMVSAGLTTALVEQRDFGVRDLVSSGDVRRLLIGVAMGLTAVALIHSPWGRRSGAHMNPAVTLAFLALGRIHRTDAIGYIAAQFVGGVAGVLLVLGLLGERFSDVPVSFVLTVPGHGPRVAFALEWLMSFVLMTTVLAVSSRADFARYAGIAAGVLVATFIAVEAPYSGMSMNPARSFASAAVAGHWADLWIYVVAPPLGMWTAALWHARRAARRGCAKLVHSRDVRCIHCGHAPPRDTRCLTPGDLVHGKH